MLGSLELHPQNTRMLLQFCQMFKQVTSVLCAIIMFVTSQQKCNNSFTAPYHSCSDPVMGTFSNNCCNGSIECDKLSLDIKGKLIIIPPKRSLGGYIGVTRWSVGWSVGRSGGRSVQRSVAFSFSNTTSYNDQAHGEKVQCTRKITPS